jgi:hypothetical protein
VMYGSHVRLTGILDFTICCVNTVVFADELLGFDAIYSLLLQH